MQKIIILVLAFFLLPFFSNAQQWKRQRKEYSFGIGATNFLGDLGGRDQVGTNGIMDYEWRALRYAVGIGYRYQLAESWYVKGNLYYALVSGDDAYTAEPARAGRQLNFKSNVVELSAQLEYMIIKQKSGHLYSLRGVRGKSWFRFEVYALGGVGGIWFDPMGERNGSWHKLKPLHTEGQGLPGGPSQYNGFSLVIPYGIGIRRNLGGGARSRTFGSWSLSLELTMRKTFSDYIDDVSTVYYDNNALRDAHGDEAAYFGDPSGKYSGLVDDGNGGLVGQQRGDPTDNDAYMMGIISINYKPARKRRNLPKF